MSLILEALRKSEAERRRGAMPDLHAELPTSPALARSTVPGWVLWMLAGATAIALLLWGLHAWWPHAAPPATARVEPSAAPITAKPALRPVPRLLPPPIANPPAPPVAAVAQPVAKPPPAAPAPPTQLLPPPALAHAPAQAPVAGPVPADDASDLSDLTPEERKALPPLKLSMHLWNDDPARRFVILDGNRMREGDRDGDAVITAITNDGVLIDWNGRRIKLSIR